jgi:poly(3-hydroxyalkanoate) synthetase
MSVTVRQALRPDARRAAEALEPEAGLLADADPIGLVEALAELSGALARDPATLGRVGARTAIDLALTGAATALRAVGIPAVGRVEPMLTDLVTNDGRPRQVDPTAFRLGDNLAATRGKVVFRNHLMELLQYEPQTEMTYEVPLLLSPPWINKYYVMDLAPGRSFAEWAVRHGHTVFAISYRNPDHTMRHVALDDYLLHGPHTALDVIGAITGSPKVNIVGLCLGGTLTTMLLAYLADRGEDRIRSATLLNTLIDFSRPGMLGSFTDARSVRRVARRMAEKGVLDGGDMKLTFDLLRANDLIWSYVGSSWLMGAELPGSRRGHRQPAEPQSAALDERRATGRRVGVASGRRRAA